MCIYKKYEKDPFGVNQIALCHKELPHPTRGPFIMIRQDKLVLFKEKHNIYTFLICFLIV